MKLFRWMLWPFRSFTITGRDGTPYLRRFYLLKTRRLSIYVHEILRSDEDRELHDHPWDFTSIILSGSYLETTRIFGLFTFNVIKQRGNIIRHKAEDAHRLTVIDGPVWTLVFTGPKRQSQ